MVEKAQYSVACDLLLLLLLILLIVERHKYIKSQNAASKHIQRSAMVLKR